MATAHPKCRECSKLQKTYESVLAQQAALNLAHLTAVQSGDSFQAHALDTSLFDTSERIRQVEMNLKSHEASHRSQTLRASGSLAG